MARNKCRMARNKCRIGELPVGQPCGEIGQPLNDRIGLALGVPDLIVRDLAVWQEDGAHTGLASTVDVVERAIADEHARSWLADSEPGHRRRERMARRLGPLDLAG